MAFLSPRVRQVISPRSNGNVYNTLGAVQSSDWNLAKESSFDWGNDQDDTAYGGASDFLKQLQAESAAEGFQTGGLSTFTEDNDDGAALSALASSSSDEEEEDNQIATREDVLKARLSLVWRTRNKLSKPRYLKLYFVSCIALQLLLYVGLFVGATRCADCTYGHLIVLIMMGGLLLGVQGGQGMNHFIDPDASFEEFDVDNPQLVYQHKRKLSWHGKMIFYPCLVAVYATLIFYTGFFSLLFGYARGADGSCKASFTDMLVNMDGAGWVYMFWQLISYTLLMFTLLLLGLAHFRAYNDTTARHNRISMVAQRWKDSLGMSADDSTPRGSVQLKSGEKSCLAKLVAGQYLRHFFLISLVLQFFLFSLLIVSRTIHNSNGEQAEIGFGMLYFWTVLGCFFWGYELGFLHNYQVKGKEATARIKTEDVHLIRSHMSWHAHMVYTSCAKCIGATTVYFVSVFSFMHNFSRSTGTCPTTPLQAISGLHVPGFVLFTLSTFLVIPIVLCEVGLCLTHFSIWKAKQKMYSAASLKLACKTN